jgi:E3 ubiquitin-protein ligase listerin
VLEDTFFDASKMNKRQFKSQASSSRAAAAGSGVGFGGGFGSGSAASSSSLSYLTQPPDFTSISDPNVVVAFKNLLKKDATTKTRALEDLRAYVRTHPYVQDNGVEEPILETWVRPLCLRTLSCILP